MFPDSLACPTPRACVLFLGTMCTCYTITIYTLEQTSTVVTIGRALSYLSSWAKDPGSSTGTKRSLADFNTVKTQ